MTAHTIAEGAVRVVEVSAAVRSDETVLIVTDDPSRPTADAIAEAARAVTDEVLMTVMPPVRHNGNEPPAAVAAAMQHAEVIFHITHRSITHTQAAAAAKTPPTRWISLTKFTPEDLARPAIFVDFARIRPHCDALAAAFTDAETARVTAPTGTDLTIDLSGSTGNSHPGIADAPGSHTALVHIEANVSPVADGVHGTAVIDGAIPDLDIGRLERPIRLEIADGRVTDIGGGEAADRIAAVWAEYDDPAVYQIAQLAVGMNPAVERFTDGFSENHARFGNVHLGIGTSIILGGQTHTPVHFDAMMGSATLTLDGTPVVVDGAEFPQIPAAVWTG